MNTNILKTIKNKIGLNLKETEKSVEELSVEETFVDEKTFKQLSELAEEKSIMTYRQKDELLNKCLSRVGLSFSVPQVGNEEDVTTNEASSQGKFFTVRAKCIKSLPLSGVLFVDLKSGNIVDWNDSAKKLLGCHQGNCAHAICSLGKPTLCRKNIREFLRDPSDCDRIGKELKKTGQVEDTSLFIKNCKNHLIPVRLAAHSYYDRKGKRQGIIFQFLQDFSVKQRIINRIMALACELLDLELEDCTSILWVVDDPKKTMLRCSAHIEAVHGDVAEGYLNQKLRLHPGVAVKFFERQHPLVIRNVSEEKWADQFQHHSFAEDHGWETTISIPLVFKSAFMGIWNIHCYHEREVSEVERRVLSLLGRQMVSELFTVDFTNLNSVFHQVESLYTQLKKSQQKQSEMQKELDKLKRAHRSITLF